MRTAEIFTRLVNTCWSLFQWSLFLAVAAALAGGGYLYVRLDDEIRRQVQQRLANHYRDLNVHVGRARFEQDRGIAVYDVSLMAPQRDSTPQTLISVEEMYLAGKMRMEELIGGQPNIEQIVIRRPQLRAIRAQDGQWNVKSLLPLPHFSEQCPVITIEDASIILEDAARPGSTPFTIRDLDLTLTPLDSSRAASNASNTARRYRVLGTITGLPARELKIEGEAGTADGSLQLVVRITDLEITPELLAEVPTLNSESLRSAELSGRADATIQISRPGTGAPIQWSAKITADRGRLAHPALPEPVTDISFSATADSKRLFIDRFVGKCGSAEISLACERAGWSSNAPLGLAAKFVGLALDERVKSALPESCAKVWQRFQPKGIVDAELRASFDGQTWRPHVTAELRGVSLTDADKFPYPLEQATGKCQYVAATANGPDQLYLDFTGFGAGRPVRIAADLTHVALEENEGEAMATGVASTPANLEAGRQATGYRGTPRRGETDRFTRHPVGWVEISGTDIPLHEQLIAALPETGEKLVRSLRPQGAVDFAFRAEWKDQAQPLADRTQKILLKDCTIHYEKFPYPLYHVNGLVTEDNRRWTLQDIEARGGSDSATVACRGESTPLANGCRVGLTFRAENVPLDNNLKLALAPPAQQAWDEIRPQGRVDFTANVIYETGQPKPLIEVTLQPRERSLSVQPVKFPYRLEQIEGTAKFREGRVEIGNVLAHHDRVVYSAAAGAWQPTPSGGWQFDLRGVNADRLMPHRDRDMLVALPPALQTIMERLQPSGTFAVHNSSLSFTKSPQSERIAAAWDVSLDCQQAALQGDFALQSVTGGIRLVGRNDGQSTQSAGELAIDSLVWKDMQLTNVRGPLWVDQSVCLFGELASQKQGQPARRVTADAFGGSLTSNLAIQHASHPNYKLDLAVGGASLNRFANERLGGPSALSGTVSGKLEISGTGRSTQTLSGNGELHVVDANIYELPVLVALLKVLRNRTPNTTAFDRCDMQFDIQGEHIHFKHLNLLGDAYSLYGQGETNLRRELDLVFYTLIGPADLPIPLWKTIAGQVSQQGLQLKVVGTLDKPDIQRKALPAVNDVLQQIQSGFQEGAATMAPSTAARDANAAPRK